MCGTKRKGAAVSVTVAQCGLLVGYYLTGWSSGNINRLNPTRHEIPHIVSYLKHISHSSLLEGSIWTLRVKPMDRHNTYSTWAGSSFEAHLYYFIPYVTFRDTFGKDRRPQMFINSSCWWAYWAGSRVLVHKNSYLVGLSGLHLSTGDYTFSCGTSICPKSFLLTLPGMATNVVNVSNISYLII